MFGRVWVGGGVSCCFGCVIGCRCRWLGCVFFFCLGRVFGLVFGFGGYGGWFVGVGCSWSCR